MAVHPPPSVLAAAYRRQGSVAAVADELGIAFETARQWLLAAGIEIRSPGRPSPGANEVQVNELVDRYSKGESFATIAAAVNVSPNTVRNRLLEAGVRVRPRPGWKY